MFSCHSDMAWSLRFVYLMKLDEEMNIFFDYEVTGVYITTGQSLNLELL